MVAAKKRNRRANRNNGGYDYLSALPDSLIHHIFSFMPIKYIPRTCILSKRWRSTWVGTPDLVFHDLYILTGKRFRRYPKLVTCFVDSVLKHHHSSESTLNKFSINFKSRHEDLKDNKLGRLKVDSWLRYAADHRVKDLSLNMFRYRFRFPEFLYYNCPLLVKLDITCSRMICPENCIAWVSLKSLTIRKALLSDDLVGKVFAGSPSLEFLELQSCYGVNQVEVMKSARLRELVIDSFRYPYGEVGVAASIFKISAPSLLVLRIRGVLYEKVLKLVQVPSVVEAELNFRMTGSNRPERVKVIGDAMKELSRASKVTVGDWCNIEYLARDDEQQHVEVVSALLEWKNVTLKSTYCQVSRVGTVRLLNGLQHVEKLVINFNPIIGFSSHAVDFAEDEVWSGHSFKHWDSNKCRSIEITVPCSNSDQSFSRKMEWLLALSKRLCPNGIVKVVRTEEAPKFPPPR